MNCLEQKREWAVLGAWEQNDKNIDIPVKDKINLTIKENVEYSNMGESTIRKLLKKKGCPFLL